MFRSSGISSPSSSSLATLGRRRRPRSLAELGPAYRNVSAISGYRHGDFAAAEAGWRTRLAASPVDWTARYNLSLALAQQNRWDEAAAQASAAFVQQPGDASVQWQFSLACASAGFVPGPLAEFLSPGPLERLARLASPGRWQVVFCAGGWLAGAALALLLLRSYGLLRHRSASAAACSALCLRRFWSCSPPGTVGRHSEMQPTHKS